ncbi:unnamed protein product [Rhizoctonia solani]|uniref:Uncharacterized protein n=1 Tax=Rhizoctonia solani TaxID=456999 RepID=A0A8H3BL34_9AGAM|nr:unnamed protein product [Rhizoctonia solani]
MNTKRIESEHHDVAVEAIPYTQTSATVNPSHNPNNPNNPQELEVDLNESPSDFLDMIRHVVDDMTRRVNENVTDQYNAADLTKYVKSNDKYV